MLSGGDGASPRRRGDRGGSAEKAGAACRWGWAATLVTAPAQVAMIAVFQKAVGR